MTQNLVSEEVKALIREMEGFSSKAYRDADGYSIGFGHLIKKGEEHLLDASLTVAEAEVFLERDIHEHQAGIRQWLKREASDHQIAALTSLAYNTGAFSGAVRRVTALYNEGRDREAGEVFLRYNKSSKDGVLSVNPNLVKRRQFEKDLFEFGGSSDLASDYRRAMSKPGSKLQTEPTAAAPKGFGQIFVLAPYDPKKLMHPAEIADGNKRALNGLTNLANELGRSKPYLGIEDDVYLTRLRREGSGL